MKIDWMRELTARQRAKIRRKRRERKMKRIAEKKDRQAREWRTKGEMKR